MHTINTKSAVIGLVINHKNKQMTLSAQMNRPAFQRISSTD